MAFPATEKLTGRRPASDEHTGAALVAGVLAVVLGVAVAALVVVLVLVGSSAHEASSDAKQALDRVSSLQKAAPAATAAAPTATRTPAATHDHASGSAAGMTATPSFAGMAPANADELAMAHQAVPAELPATQPGPVAHVNLSIRHEMISIAPGIQYQTWSFGPSAPGPVIHVRQGQTVRVTLTNDSPMPHSVDFHAARIAPNVAFRDIAPGESFSFEFTAGDPGVYMYHCGTKPVLAHIANGMYGAIVVDPPAGTLPKADREYVLVSSEWYLNSPGIDSPASLDLVKARQMTPDWVTWNGYAGQYVKHPLTANPGETVRFWVVAAGPSLDTDFHVVGTLLDRAWINQDLTSFQRNVQTALVPAGGGAVFDVKIDQPGLYPFVSHSFASVDMGQVGLLKVGEVAGTMSH